MLQCMSNAIVRLRAPGNLAQSGGVLRQPNAILPTSGWLLLAQDEVPDVEEEEEPGVDASGADNSDAALALLRALSRADPEVRSRVRACLTARYCLAWQRWSSSCPECTGVPPYRSMPSVFPPALASDPTCCACHAGQVENQRQPRSTASTEVLNHVSRAAAAFGVDGSSTVSEGIPARQQGCGP